MSRSRAARLREANRVLLEEGRLEAVEDFFTPDYVAHLTRRKLEGPEAVRRFVRALRRAFTGLEVEVEVLVSGRDRVAWQRTLRGTHAADYRGFPASGRRIVWRDAITSRFEGQRIAEEWSLSDLAEQLLRARRR